MKETTAFFEVPHWHFPGASEENSIKATGFQANTRTRDLLSAKQEYYRERLKSILPHCFRFIIH
jgi:hypothetical protein